MCKRLVETIFLLCGRIIESTHPTKRCKKAEESGTDYDDPEEEIWSFQRKDEKKNSQEKKSKKKVEFTEEQKEELRKLKEEVELSNDHAILAIFQGWRRVF